MTQVGRVGSRMKSRLKQVQATNLQCMRLHVDDARDDTLDQVAASSSLQSLYVFSNGGFSHRCVANLAHELRNNSTLSSVSLVGGSDMPRDERARLFRPLRRPWKRTSLLSRR